MSTSTKSALIATVLATAGIMASAAIAPTSGRGAYGEQLVALQGGSTLHIYKDGKMAEENAYGRPTVMAPGQQLHDQNGATITMNGDEVARLSMEQFPKNR
ncbi:copper resistance protein K precursor [mine drainage metagenome]|uniref:Copper resistance protein K n=1 Tax=mine drainage metagenome TaxID=410659 RepID=A0A1J5PW93_9ZZZZ